MQEYVKSFSNFTLNMNSHLVISRKYVGRYRQSIFQTHWINEEPCVTKISKITKYIFCKEFKYSVFCYIFLCIYEWVYLVFHRFHLEYKDFIKIVTLFSQGNILSNTSNHQWKCLSRWLNNYMYVISSTLQETNCL